jgi:predicted MPP superfamily phosphohydrolase
MIEVGLKAPLHIREERVSHRSDASRVLYVSDIHLRKRRSEAISRQVLDAVSRCAPDLVLLGGDLVDGVSELAALSALVRDISDTAPVLAIGGNHDHRVGIDRVAEAVELGGGGWIHECGARITHDGRLISVAGPETTTPMDGDVRILCAHNPRIWKSSRDAGYDLVLAGHLHGFQLVACEYRDRLYPGAIFYPYCFLSHQRGQTRLVVSRGVSDLLPIRWMCPREVVLCHV